MKLRMNRNIGKFVMISVGLFLLGILLFRLLYAWEIGLGVTDTEYPKNDGRIYIDGDWYIPRKKLDTVLLIGVDKYEAQTTASSYNNTQQADFLMLLLIDAEEKAYTALHLNRDTMTNIQKLGVRGEPAGTFTGQLALAHTYGSGGKDSCRNTVDAVSNFLYGVDIDHYISLTMDAVAEINDAAGGVTLTLLEDFTALDPTMVKGAEVTLSGDMALSYVRARYGLADSTNLGRMERQRQYLGALRQKLIDADAKDDGFFLQIMETVSEYVVSDCTANQLSRLYERVAEYTAGDIVSVAGEAVQGEEFMEFYADEEALKKQVVQLFYEPVAD